MIAQNFKDPIVIDTNYNWCASGLISIADLKLKFDELNHYSPINTLISDDEISKMLEDINELFSDSNSELFDGNYKVYENPLYEPLESTKDLGENLLDLFEEIDSSEFEFSSDSEESEINITLCNAGFKTNIEGKRKINGRIPLFKNTPRQTKYLKAADLSKSFEYSDNVTQIPNVLDCARIKINQLIDSSLEITDDILNIFYYFENLCRTHNEYELCHNGNLFRKYYDLEYKKEYGYHENRLYIENGV